MLLFLFSIFYYSCDKNSTPPEDTGVKPIEPEMVLIDKDLTFSYFLDRAEEKDIKNKERERIITIEAYYIGKYELTNLEYYQFLKDSGYSNRSVWSEESWQWISNFNRKEPKFWSLDVDPPYKNDPHSNQDETPVHGITFYEAEAYCNWLSKKTGKEYSIPTSAQWQRAAKGPDPGYLYPWGNEMIEENFHYIYENPDFVLLTVNSFPQGLSPDGCYHMVGNVYEYAVPIIPLYKDSTKVSLYSYPDYAQSSTYGYKLSMTISGVIPSDKYHREPGDGLRICRNF